MAKRSDSTLSLAFVAHQPAEHTAIEARKERLGENDFQASRTLSEESSIINCCKQGIALTDRFFITRRAICHSE